MPQQLIGLTLWWGEGLGGDVLIQSFIHLRPRSSFIILFCVCVCACARVRVCACVRVEVQLKQAGLKYECIYMYIDISKNVK